MVIIPWSSGRTIAEQRKSIAVALANKGGDSRICLGQRLLVWEEHNAEVLRAGLLTEAGPLDDHDMLLADQFLYERLVALRDVDT